jgi:hypothetical protein
MIKEMREKAGGQLGATTTLDAHSGARVRYFTNFTSDGIKSTAPRVARLAMADSSAQGSDDAGHHETAPPSPGFTDIAPIIFSNLASNAAEKGELAELCALVASTDVAGALGRPGLSRDALLNAIWASVTSAADAMSGSDMSNAMPSLRNALLDSKGGTLPLRMLKVLPLVSFSFFP